MLFNSFAFLVFFPLVTTLYFLLPHKFRWALLLMASCVFYMYFIPVYILILAATIGIDYFAGLAIHKYSGTSRKWILWISIVSNVSMLAFFKYGNFTIENINQLSSALGWNYSLSTLSWVLPVGLSFHTFQAMSYTIEVYRGNQKPEKHIGIYALYVMYYPQLVAGPIERPQHVLPQLHSSHSWDWLRVGNGLQQMLWGFFKKLVIADRIASLINPVYNNPDHYEGISLFVAAALFSFQIYCDFSGYSDIALGASRVMGIELMQNFRNPYFSSSVAEFWSRWHISLTSWFRDYLYIPLGGNRISERRTTLNVLLVFALSGLWHGADWKFVWWGLLLGLFIIGEKYIQKNSIDKNKLSISWIRVLYVFLVIQFTWIFFRASDLSSAWYIITHAYSGIYVYLNHVFAADGHLWLEPLIFKKDVHLYYMEFVVLIVAIAFMEIIQFWEGKGKVSDWMFSTSKVIHWSLNLFILYMILFFGLFHNGTEFIYFQF